MTSNESSNASSSRSSSPPPLNYRNWLNLGFYIVNVLVTYGVGTLGWVGHGNNAELSEKYQTLITPNASAFAIWAIIFLSQGIFAIVQLLPQYRATQIVQDGVQSYYAWTCFFQAAWTLAFAYEHMFMAFMFMTHIWASLLGIVWNQSRISPMDKPNDDTGTDDSSFQTRLIDFGIFRFPFLIHFGWLTAATALNASVFAVSQDATAVQQLALGIVSLAVLHAVSVWVLFATHRANYTVAAVLSWATWWIHVELQHPKSTIVELFSQDAIEGVSLAAQAVAYIIVVQIAVCIGLQFQSYIVLGNTTSSGGEVDNEDEENTHDASVFRPLL